MKGYSMQDLVDKLSGKISKQAISRYENGAMEPTNLNILYLSKALGVKVDYFERETTVDFQKPSYRKFSRLPVKEQNRIEHIVIDYLERYLELESIIGEQNRIDFFEGQYLIRNFEEVENAAIDLRNKLGLGEDPLHNIVEMFEEKGIKVVEIKADLAFSGFATTINNNQPIVVLNVNEAISLDRRRFTALHELGHLVLKFHEIDKKKEEYYCNRFAGAILIPKSRMIQKIGRNRNNIHMKELLFLKQEYGISMQAALYRAKDLDIISNYQFSHQMSVFSKMGFRKNEPGSFCGEERSNRFLQLLCRGIAEEIISISKAAALNNMKVAEFMEVLTMLK